MIPNMRQQKSRGILDPNERVAEVLFGLIMVLTFTGSLSVADSGREDVRAMLIGALGCNLAWGIIDGILYLMGSLAEKWRNLSLFRAMREADDPAQARQLISERLPSTIVRVLSDAELDSFHQRLRTLPEPPSRAHLSAEEWRGALGVMLLVFLSTFPVSLPFVFMHQLELAMRVSNLIAIVLLFICGAIYGRCVGRSPWLVGVSMVVLGGFLVGMTIALGG